MIEINGLTKRYGGISALHEVTLTVIPGEVVALVGPSGCGKTTLLRIISGLDCPDEGSVAIDNAVVSTRNHLVAPCERRLSLIFQELALWPHMTVAEHIEFVLENEDLSRGELRSRIQYVLQKVDMNGYFSRYPHELSGGEKQRLAIARSIAGNPGYLLMDEPFSNLDSLLKEEMRRLVLSLKSELNMGIVYVSHNLDELVTQADRIAVMKEGKILQFGDRNTVHREPSHDFVKRFLRII